jgi:hypothetical protein
MAHRDTINPQFREGKSTMTRKQKAVGRTHAIVPEQAVQKSQKQKFPRAPNRFGRAFTQYDEGGDATICASRIRYRFLEGRLRKKVEKCGECRWRRPDHDLEIKINVRNGQSAADVITALRVIIKDTKKHGLPPFKSVDG